MTEVIVIDTGCNDSAGDDISGNDISGNDIAGLIASGIEEYGGNNGDVLIRSIRSLSEISKKAPDVLVLTEESAKCCHDETRTEKHRHISCGILLLPGDVVVCDTDSDIFDADCIVTYGMSPKNTITLSSISEETCVLALQRELITTKGDVLERQEIKIKGGLRPDCLLTVAGALLILGQKISDINQ